MDELGGRSAKLKQWLDHLLHLPSDLLELPLDGTPDERLREMLACWGQFLVNPNDPSYIRAAAERLAQRVINDNKRLDVIDFVIQLLARIEDAIARALAAGATDPSIFPTAVIPPEARRVLNLGPLGWSPPIDSQRGLQPSLVWIGLVSGLPEGHPLRTILPDDDYYRHGGLDHAKALVLGLPEPTLTGTGRPRPFYFLADVLRWTALLRNNQRQQEAERAEQERREREENQRKWLASPMGVHHQRQALLDRLKSEGKLPEIGTTGIDDLIAISDLNKP